MPSRICKDCQLKYPVEKQYENCHSCGESTSWQPYVALPSDWEDVLRDALKSGVEVADPVIQWRLDRLIEAGYEPLEAFTLATDRGIDIHAAGKLRSQTDLAYQILS